MSEYQAIYDAVRSRISGGDIGSAVKDVLQQSFDISYEIQSIKREMLSVTYEMQRPFYLLRPDIYKDGDEWCCLYGPDLQIGVVGFGKTPDEAARKFDEAWVRGTGDE